MQHNLVPNFIMRESGATVNYVAKIHFPFPSADDHCISFVSSDLQIPPPISIVLSVISRANV